MIKDVKAAIGRQGEDQVASLLANIPGCKLYRNLYIPSGGRTIEIDAVLLSPKGIFVIEAKSYSGTIRGSATRYEWSVTRKGAHGKPPQKFYSPLKQNATHVAHLSRYLDVPSATCHSIIVFTTRANLKNVRIANAPNHTVLQTPTLRSTILRLLQTRQNRFTPKKLEELQNRLNSLPRPTKRQQQAHIRHAKQAEKARKAKL